MLQLIPPAKGKNMEYSKEEKRILDHLKVKDFEELIRLVNKGRQYEKLEELGVLVNDPDFSDDFDDDDEIESDIDWSIIKEGLPRYKRIMDMVNTKEFCSDKFKKEFNYFYKIRQKSAYFYDCYYKVMNECKINKLTFRDVITRLYELTGEIHASFSSKIIATINPDMPIWDQYVIKNLKLHDPTYGSKEQRIEKKIKIYESICDWYEEYILLSDGEEDIKTFNEKFPEYMDISDTKKIDFMLWAKR